MSISLTERLLTMLANVREASKGLGCNYYKLYHMIQRKELRAKKVGGRLLVDIDRARAVINALDGLKAKRSQA